ncbi:FAD-dependent monooxygenase [Caenimonas sp. SL110]|uniref:FAD-dependent monooxygenase n=1 Tax=Caenimonas sp. SL110 TaxID=1450524 RepID=UPI0006540CCE|nr:FAD-dependent monooxygenase [Caenimonas sp. SL110]
MAQQLFIAGGGIGGLAAALACARAGWEPLVFEQAHELSEVGAGIQLGPNATRLLHAWGLADALSSVASFPMRLDVRSASSGAQLASMDLAGFSARYGAPYAAIHRADLQSMLLRQVSELGVQPQTDMRVTAAHDGAHAVMASVRGIDAVVRNIECDALVGADGLWSAVRGAVNADGPPLATGHVAWRALAVQSQLPVKLRTSEVNVWLGPRLHFVAYPVRGGQMLNAVAIVHGQGSGAASDWDQAGAVSDLHRAMGSMCAPLNELVHALDNWRLWTLHDRDPMRGPQSMAKGRIALVGDAAHPMRPYLAQGAAMAIEDAAELGRCLAMVEGADIEVPLALARYALNRWERAARVQSRARRNGRIFHATGVVRWGRDLSMRLLGERLLDQPWLYAG